MREDVKAIQVFIDSMVGIEGFSYPARQEGAKRPEGEFAHIRLLEEYPVGIPNQQVVAQDDVSITYRTYSPARLRFRIGVVDTNGVPSSKVLHGWTSEAMKQLMMETGVGFIKVTPLSNEDAKLEKEWEIRQGFSLEVYTTRVYEEVISTIGTVETTGRYVTENLDSILLNININEE